MTAMFCSRHQTGWDSPPALCPVCQDAKDNGGKTAHMDPTPQEVSDNRSPQPDTPRVNYARSCGTGALTVEACKLERELATAASALSEVRSALADLHAMVWGECPSLLNEDSGGAAHLDLRIRDLLTGAPK